jgi:hypothetical protein
MNLDIYIDRLWDVVDDCLSLLCTAEDPDEIEFVRDILDWALNLINDLENS